MSPNIRTDVHADVVVIGAGASGLMCALRCAERGQSVILLDHADRSGRKLRISGGGRCNFTNTGAQAASYVCANPHFVKSALARFSPAETIAFMKNLGLPAHEEDRGKFFSKNAGQVALALEQAALGAGAKLLLKTTVRGAEQSGAGFRVFTDRGGFVCRSLVVALGSPAWPQAGATGLGHNLAKSFGLKVTPVRPGLVPLLAAPEILPLCRGLAGTALPVRITIEQGAKPKGKAKAAPVIDGDLLFTHKGISGPAVLDASLYLPQDNTQSVPLLDLLPGIDPVDTLEEMGRKDIRNALAALLPKRLAVALCERHGWTGPVASMPKKRLLAMGELLRAYPFPVAGDEGFARAEVALGGVDTAGVDSKTMRARDVPGLYFTGEVLDVTGRLGGFNLQWAWSSGHAAGLYA